MLPITDNSPLITPGTPITLRLKRNIPLRPTTTAHIPQRMSVLRLLQIPVLAPSAGEEGVDAQREEQELQDEDGDCGVVCETLDNRTISEGVGW